MSHRKFSAPRHGSLAFLPRKRSCTFRGRIRAYPKDDPSQPPHLTAFTGYKAGCTHILREVNRLGSSLNKKEVVECVTIIETAPMIGIGIAGYVETTTGLRCLTTVWTANMSDDAKRRFYKRWYRSKKKAFTRYAKTVAHSEEGNIKKNLERIAKYCKVVRLICHTQPRLVTLNKGVQKKAHIQEIQINGGRTVQEKIDYAKKFFEQPIPITECFQEQDVIDTIGVTTGKGFKGVISRWGVARLPRKTHKGLRKVACIGSWHPANVQYSVARAGQKGFHHRVEKGKKIYKIGDGKDKNSATTKFDITEKGITPMGGFRRWGAIDNQFVMIKGSCQGTPGRPITLRKTLLPHVSRAHQEQVVLKFIDTSSKVGHGHFQTTAEKNKWYGSTKKYRAIQANKVARKLAEEEAVAATQ
mmetsp:Transcript_15092/g.16792  ORF Transcript_15092/g.16792 Transcript_15092/m.16792 type:complete len:414 (-) Transcript_15092:34-1275(-)